MKNMKNMKGITLIALIITIIVMIILVAVTVNIAINGGLFGQTQEAAKQQEEQTIYEQILGMTVWNQDGSINVKATVEEIENSRIITLKSKNPSEVTDSTTSVTITVTGKHGEYKYKISQTEITIEGNNGGGTGLLAEIQEELIGKNILPEEENSATTSISETENGLSITFKNPQIIFDSYIERLEIFIVEYKGEKFNLFIQEGGTISDVTSYIPPKENDDGIFAISILDEGNKEVSIIGFGENGATWLTNNNGALVIPRNITYNNETYVVKQIGEYAFQSNENITSLQFETGSQVEVIGEHAFESAGITTLTLNEGLTTIENGAFNDCRNLTGNLIIPSNIETIGEYAFSYTGITGLTFNGNNLTTIGNGAFYGCESLTGTITIPSSVQIIKEGAFAHNYYITGLVFSGNSLITIETGAFDNCWGITGTLTIPSSVQTIGENAFNNLNNLTSIIVSRNVEGSPWGSGAEIIYSD